LLLPLFFAFDFVVNILQLTRKIRTNTRITATNSTIILIEEKLVPHSFFHFIFLNKDEYDQQKISDQILAHEITHVRQLHSLDVLVIEFLKRLFWFNPIFRLYKEAIQLNHEYLADESVIQASGDIVSYQQLLVQVAGLKTIKLASNLNFHLTKKRLVMMSRKVSKTTILVKEALLIPSALIILLLFAGNSVADKREGLFASSTTDTRDAFFKGGIIEFTNGSGEVVKKLYEDMTKKEKQQLAVPLQPTQVQIQEWKNNTKYRILIDMKEVENNKLNDYQSSDFSYYGAKSLNQEQIYVDLLTPQFFTSFKRFGGIYNWKDGQLRLKLPPPVVVSPK